MKGDRDGSIVTKAYPKLLSYGPESWSHGTLSATVFVCLFTFYCSKADIRFHRVWVEFILPLLSRRHGNASQPELHEAEEAVLCSTLSFLFPLKHLFFLIFYNQCDLQLGFL